MALAFPRGGAVAVASSGLLGKLANWKSTPQALFNSTLMALALVTLMAKLLQRLTASEDSKETQRAKPESVKTLQRRFLAVFWLLRCSDWLQGPYFYEVYASKMFNGVQASMSLVSRLFLTGFASTALFGPSVGRAADTYGRKKATLAFSVIYALGALSTKSTLLQLLFLGRILSGIGTSLLFSAPESWLVGEAQKTGDDPDGKYLGETFGLAYAGDSVVAILAGQMAGMAAAQRGATGPFELSTVVLLLGGLLAALLWKENTASGGGEGGKSEKPSIREAIQVIKDDPKIMLVGGTQSLFEAAMYIFVLQWPPAMTKAIGGVFGESAAATPYGTIFSCFMASCLLGSTMFGQLAKMAVPTETFTVAMLTVATLAMSGATWMVSSSSVNVLWGLMASFFAFEACVGMYFPSIGTLRSKYVPDSHRSVIMNLFGIPLNVLVVSVFLSIQKLGVKGALAISSGSLGLATIAMFQLRRMVRRDAAKKIVE
jgi:MFS family permease